MRKLRIFAVFFIFAAGATSCKKDNVKDDELIVDPVEGVTSLNETFSGLALNAKAASYNGWSELNVKGGISWKGAAKGDNKYVEISATGGANDADCEAWLLTPALDLANAPDKKLSFKTQYAYWRENTSLEVYLLAKHSTDNAVKLAIGEAPDYVRIAKQEDAADKWIESGSIDLSSHASLGVVYVAFRYAAKGGADKSTTFRIDDVTLGVDGGSSGGDETGVPSLSEDFESFVDGRGASYMSKQPDSKGWIGVNVQGGKDKLEPDVREFNNNKYVQFSAHRGSITAAETQEFWLISPSLDLDKATSKNVSFDVSAGYYSKGTIFEVYILNGSNPGTASKEKLAWNEPQTIPVNGYSGFASSGSIDLSAYSGVQRIGFYYKGTSGSGNSTTYQMDNFLFGVDATATPVLRFTSAASLAAIVGDVFSHTFTLEEKNLKDSTVISCSGLPDWISFNEKTITGTPPDTASSCLVTVTATNGSITATQELIITVAKKPSPSSNLVVNGSFEDFGGALPVGWSYGAQTDSSSIFKETSSAQEGRFAVKIVASNDGTRALKQVIPGIASGTTYTVSFWYKNNTGGSSDNSGVRIWASFLDGNSKPIKDASADKILHPNTLKPTTEWTLYTVDVMAPDKAVGFNFELRATRGTEGVFDNCSLVAK